VLKTVLVKNFCVEFLTYPSDNLTKCVCVI